MIIRECEVSDYKRICEINKSAFGYVYDLEKTKDRLTTILKSSTNKIYVACNQEEVIGYIHGSDYECTYNDSLKNIMAFAVDPKYQGKGIGKALLHCLEDWAKQCQCCGVRLVSGFDRTSAHAFYLRCGYVERKRQKNFIKIFEDNK